MRTLVPVYVLPGRAFFRSKMGKKWCWGCTWGCVWGCIFALAKTKCIGEGLRLGLHFTMFYFVFNPTNFQNGGENTAFSYVFVYQNNKAHRIRGALLIVKSYKIATYRILGCRRAYISKEFADTAQHFVHFDDAALVELLLIKAVCIDRHKKKFVWVF